MDQTLETLRSTLGDRYRVDKAVGRGGMATVYSAADLRHDRTVAIKVMSPELAATISAERFTREVKIAAQLSHPSILGVFDSGETNGLLYYVMPFVDGESLRDKLIRERQLSIDESIQITCEVAEALGYAHERGIVHRDIKPENILLQGGHAMVADFGIARLVEQGAEKLTRTGMAVGTAAYMSPEQAAGEPTDARSDVYALGCTLFEMLAGHPPFVGASAMAIMSQHALATVPEIRAMRTSVPPELDAVIRRAMEKTAADRFQSMDDFKRAVLGEIPATTTSLPKYTARYRTQTAPTASRRSWGLPAIIAGALVVTAAGAFAWSKRERTPALAEDSKKIAVLYLADATGGRLQHIADGLTESVIERLDPIQDLDVVPQNGVRPFRGHTVSADSIHAAFGSGTIVTGSVDTAGSRVKVDVNVMDASGTSIVRRNFSFDTVSIATEQEAVSTDIAELLRKTIGSETSAKAARAQTSSSAAWILSQRAAKRRKDADSLLGVKAIDPGYAALMGADSLLVQAQAADPRWSKLPAARASLSITVAQLMPLRSREQRAAIDSGLARANAAIALQANDADALEAKGKLLYLRYYFGLDDNDRVARATLDSAEAALRRAVDLKPKQAGAWVALSNLYYARPDIPSAARAAREAYEADAYLASANAILQRLFWTSHDYEQFTDAQKWCETGRKRFPADPFFVECQLWMYTTQLGAPTIDDAWKAESIYVSMHDQAAKPYAERYAKTLVAGAIARAGLADSARHVLSSARPARLSDDPQGDLAGNEAVVRVILHDYDEAITLIQRFLAVHPEHRKGFATRVSPWWRDPKLQEHPRFKALLAGAR